jgi:hypothetical protein
LGEIKKWQHSFETQIFSFFSFKFFFKMVKENQASTKNLLKKFLLPQCKNSPPKNKTLDKNTKLQPTNLEDLSILHISCTKKSFKGKP